MIVHLLHAFPSGRLRGRASKWTVAVGYFVVLILQMPIYLWGQGEKGGPTTVLEIADDHTLSHIGQYLQAAVGAAVMVSTAIILTSRLRRTEPSRRRVVAPLMSTAASRSSSCRSPASSVRPGCRSGPSASRSAS